MTFSVKQKPIRTIYLDCAAATPVDPDVLATMRPYLEQLYFNPSGLSSASVAVRKAVDDARANIALILGTQPDSVVFTSGGTESTNMAVFGCMKVLEHKNIKAGHIITSAIEHHAVLNPIKQLEKQGWKVTYLPVSEKGAVTSVQVRKALRKSTVLVSIMYANNEIGAIEPIGEIGREILKWRKENKTVYPYFHTDACQAAAYLDLHVDRLHVDLMSLNGSKIYGPKGVGVLYKRRVVPFESLMYGGGQEFGLRSGTENVAGIIGLAKALELTIEEQGARSKEQNELRNYFWQEIQKKVPDVSLNGPIIHTPSSMRGGLGRGHNAPRLANNLNITFKGIDAEALIIYLDSYGIIAASGSACASVSDEASHVLLACGLSKEDARSSVRFTLGKITTKPDIEYVMKYLPKIVMELRHTTELAFRQ